MSWDAAPPADSGLAFAAQPTYGDPATVEMPAYNAYSYNTRSEVTGAARRWGAPGASGDLVLGQQYTYEFDGIGTRITAAEGDTARTASYNANALNQYTQRTVPDEKDLIGTAPTNVAVTVNNDPVTRQSAYWHHALEVTNAASAAYPQVAISAVYNPPGTNDPDVVTSATGHVFVAKTPEQFTYDHDGNLTQDGRFDYTWNGENRLIKAETRDDLPVDVPRVKVEYAYDHQGRRIASGTSIWTNDAWQAAESRSFVYDGWNVVIELTHSQTHTLTNLYTWGLDLSGSIQSAGGIGGLLAASLDSTTVLYSYDANGNVGQLVSTDGELLAHYEYSPFGETLLATGEMAFANPFRFSTKYHEHESGLVYYGYRFYSPTLGRFVSRDPLGDTAFRRDYGKGRSRRLREELARRALLPTYLFTLNSPLVFLDLLGLDVKNTCAKPICIRIDDDWKEIPPGGSEQGDVDGIYSRGKQYKWVDCFDASITCPKEGDPEVDLDYKFLKNCKYKNSLAEKLKCICKCDAILRAWALQAATGGWSTPGPWPPPTHEKCPSEVPAE